MQNPILQDASIARINQDTIECYTNLARVYEGEFSNLTHKTPDEFGVFHPDTMPIEPYIGYLVYYNHLPSGFMVINITSDINDVAEFYIIPVFRRKGLGRYLAVNIFSQYPGKWQVRQIEGAFKAINFWRGVIGAYNEQSYDESVEQDPEWGLVTKQTFDNTKRGINR